MLKETMNNLTKICLLLISVIFASNADAIPEQCFRMPNQNNVCEHVIYKTIKNLDAKSIVGDQDVYCVCLQDFNHLILLGTTASERELQALDIEKISKQFDITEQQLLRLIRY